MTCSRCPASRRAQRSAPPITCASLRIASQRHGERRGTVVISLRHGCRCRLGRRYLVDTRRPQPQCFGLVRKPAPATPDSRFRFPIPDPRSAIPIRDPQRRDLPERQVLREAPRRQPFHGACKQRQHRASRGIGATRAAPEVRGHVGATECRLEMARVEFRRPHHHRDAVEGRPSLRVREHHAGDLDAFATLSRRRQTHDRRVVGRACRDIGGREEPDLHATQRAWRARVVGVVRHSRAGPEIGHEALQPGVAGGRREQCATHSVRINACASATSRRLASGGSTRASGSASSGALSAWTAAAASASTSARSAWRNSAIACSTAVSSQARSRPLAVPLSSAAAGTPARRTSAMVRASDGTKPGWRAVIAEERQRALLACSRDDTRHDGFEAEARDRRQATRHQRGRGEADAETHPSGALDAERRRGAVEHVSHDVVGLLVRRGQDADAGGAMGRAHADGRPRGARPQRRVPRCTRHPAAQRRALERPGRSAAPVQACLEVWGLRPGRHRPRADVEWTSRLACPGSQCQGSLDAETWNVAAV